MVQRTSILEMPNDLFIEYSDQFKRDCVKEVTYGTSIVNDVPYISATGLGTSV